jgi:hypothetical protein
MVTLETKDEFVRLARQLRGQLVEGPPAGTPTTTLETFLQSMGLTELLPALRAQGAATLGDLLELSEQDFSFIEKVVPRRKLINALKQHRAS